MNVDDKEKRCRKLVEKSKKIIRETFEKFKSSDLAVTWTGGKDSTLNLWIVRQVCLEQNRDLPRVMTIDEGDAFPEITDFLIAISK